MKKIYRLRTCLLIPSLVLVSFINTLSQDRCGTVEYSKTLENNNSTREKESDFERWLTKSIDERKSRINAISAFKIPVVVHVIHKGEAVGVGLNISEAQVQSQIDVLNKDFNRLNSDSTNTPSEFLPVAGSINLEFVLAKQTPDGLPTNGIVRVRGPKNVWTIDDDESLKDSSYWPAEDYLNIWVTDLGMGLLGYAQFPISGLPGLGGADENRLTDGVVIDYLAFGSVDNGAFNLYSGFNKGRAATHEIGHFFGLRHIWGDDEGQCGGLGDYVNDTPDQGDKTSGCPTHPYTTCGNHTMFQNYMDYTNDNCMNLYTQGQVSRIETVISESPRRASLYNSHGLIDPEPLANDMGILEITSPGVSECASSLQPAVIVKNNGLNAVSSTMVKVMLNDNVIETKTFSFSPPLQPSETTEVAFSTAPVNPGNNLFLFDIVQTNGASDTKLPDNHKDVTTYIPHPASLPLQENLDVLPTTWAVQNPDGEITWAIRQATNSTSSNKAIYLDFYQYNNAIGEIDRLITPLLDLSKAASPYLIFDVAYSRYQNKNDGLKIYAVSNCTSVDDGVEVYSKYGSSLSTTTSRNNSFVPSGAEQWRKEIIDLSEFIEQEKFQLAFVGINDNGNNLYLDDVRIIGDLSENIAIKQVTNPSPVQCNEETTPALFIENIGSSPVNTLKIKYTVNSSPAQTTTITDLNVQPGAQAEITLPSINLSEGENTLSFEIFEPNGLPDIHPEDNKATIKTTLNSFRDHIPLRENFNDDWESAWSIVNPSDEMKWKETTTNFYKSIYFKAYSNSTIGDQAWLVSPILDFSNASAASVFFDLSYRYRDPANDELKILASRDCGESYNEVLYAKSGSSIRGLSSASEWVPVLPSDWDRVYINLNSLVGEGSVRLAFVFTNANGNNIYLDNIEFFTSDDPDPFVPENLYTIYRNGTTESFDDFYITFNLDTRQPVHVEIVNMAGQLISSQELQDVLNQIFQIDISNRSTGIYIVRLFINNRYYADKIYLGQ